MQPTISSVIHPTGNSAKCVGIQGNMLTNGTPVQVYVCWMDLYTLFNGFFSFVVGMIVMVPISSAGLFLLVVIK